MSIRATRQKKSTHHKFVLLIIYLFIKLTVKKTNNKQSPKNEKKTIFLKKFKLTFLTEIHRILIFWFESQLVVSLLKIKNPFYPLK